MMKIGILGIPFNGDGTRPEIENPTKALRDAGLTGMQLRNGDTLLDYGDLPIPVFDGRRDPITKILNLNVWKEVSRVTAVKLRSIQKEVDFVLILGGDCSILLGIFGAFRLAEKHVGLLMLDGHTDYRDAFSSSSGEPADLELAILTGRGPFELTGLFGLPPLLEPTDVVVCGYREPDLIAESNILHYNRQAFREAGAGSLEIQAVSLLEHVERLWFHLDVDVLDPSLMPVCFPEPDGLTIYETQAFLATSIRSKKFMGVSVSCYHPNLDSNLKAASKVVSILDSALSSGN